MNLSLRFDESEIQFRDEICLKFSIEYKGHNFNIKFFENLKDFEAMNRSFSEGTTIEHEISLLQKISFYIGGRPLMIKQIGEFNRIKFYVKCQGKCFSEKEDDSFIASIKEIEKNWKPNTNESASSTTLSFAS